MTPIITLSILLFSLLPIISSSNPTFIVFSNDGTFYKLDPQTKQVQWHSELPFKLLSFNITSHQLATNESSKFLIPTMEGDFLYLQPNLSKYPRQILVLRQDVEHLLHMCFDTTKQQKYLVYQQLEYFVLDTDTGEFVNLELFFTQKQILNRATHAILIVSRKLLKQFNIKMEVKWSVISSKVALKSIDEFSTSNSIQQHEQLHHKYTFIRLNSQIMSILDQNLSPTFQFQVSSSVMAIFTKDKKTGKFSKILIKNSQPKILALSEAKSESNAHKLSTGIANTITSLSNKFDDFPYSSNYISNKPQLKDPTDQFDNLQMCINTHRIIKQSRLLNKPQIIHPQTNQQHFNLYGQLDFNNQQDIKFQPTVIYPNDKKIKVIITKQQPFVYIFLIVIIVGGGFLFYRFKVNKLWEQMCQESTTTNQNLKQISAKLDQYQNVGKQMKKIYDINWDNIIYKNSMYFVFQGKFLNQNAQVFVLPLKDSNITQIQHKLNYLINCSHKSIIKLYYFTRNDQSLLIFCQHTPEYKTLKQFSTSNNSNAQLLSHLTKSKQNYKNCIKVLLTSLKQLMLLKIQINSLVPQSLLIKYRNDGKIDVDVKVNIVSSFFFKNSQHSKKYISMGTTQFRLDLVSAIHRMTHYHQQFDLLAFNSQSEQSELLKDFYNQILVTVNDESNIQVIKGAEKHPFLWDSMHKMLYITSFSNYIETYLDQSKLSKMQQHCRNYKIIQFPWVNQLHHTLSKQINNYRKYDFNSIRDLIRFIRNKINHFNQIPKQAKIHIGKTPEQFIEHIFDKFPKLLAFMYAYDNKKKWKINSVH